MAYKSSSGAQPENSKWQESLLGACRDYYYPEPKYQLVSERRGGRTAWSAEVNVNGVVITARFWYDGKNTNNAKEDAAEVAYNMLMSGQSSPSTSRSGW